MTIYIGDNAAGIGVNNYWRAFEPANIPTDNTGLNEYGMGMKTAGIWLSDYWDVTTTALGETAVRKMVFDANKIEKSINQYGYEIENSKRYLISMKKLLEF